MLGQRVLTAIVLLAIVAGALAAPGPWPMLVLLIVLAAGALWESLRLVDAGRLAVPVAVALGGVLLWAAALWTGALPDPAPFDAVFARGLVPLAVLFWVFAATTMVVRAQPQPHGNPRIMSIVLVLLLAAVWYALAWIFLVHGAAALLSLLALIWCADIGAYFAGRALGRHKLAPRVSPGKTLEGAVAGVALACLWLVATALWWPGSFGALLLERGSLAWVIGVGIILAVWSIIGDLFESLLKRRAGVKDSSALLPGHGGIYDRIDAVLPVAPMAWLLLKA